MTTNASYFDMMFDAIRRGDTSAYQELEEYMLLIKLAGGSSPEKSVTTGLRNAIKRKLDAGMISLEDATEMVMQYAPYKTNKYEYTYKTLKGNDDSE